MNPIVRTIFRSNLWAFPIFAILLFAANWVLVADIIPIKHLLLVALLFAVYYSWMFYIIVKGVWGSWKEKLLAICAMVVLLLTIETTLEFLIYDYFPSLGVYLDRYILEIPDYVHDASEFRQRWISGMLFIFLLVAIRVGFRVMKKKMREEKDVKKQIKEMQNHIRNLHSLLKSRQLNPHFIENFVAIALGKEKRNPNKENGKMLMLLTQLMYYQLSMDDGQQTTSWQDEMEQVDNLLKMASYCDKNFVYERTDCASLENLGVPIPHGLLLMPLENALKYGVNVKGRPLRVFFEKRGSTIRVRYNNYYDRMRRARMKTSGTGFQLMNARLEGNKFPIKLAKQEADDQFFVHIEIETG